ncbi:MAG: hypothetical protein QF554_01630 [Dehalococcoidia bacterium]|jgi:hypothetical protein|nr:hypothetical protein [Dehalococcoidia bacterium]
MANLVLGLITIATLMTGALTFTVTAIDGAGSNADAFEAAADSRSQIVRSSLRHVPGCVIALGTTLTATIENNGQSTLRDFGDWDVLAHYESTSSLRAEWLSYESIAPAGSGEWTLADIRLLNGRSEAFGAGELDPGERATVTVELPMSAIASGLNRLTIGTSEGAVVEIPFDGTTTCGYYLHNDPSPPSGDTTSQADLTADVSYPSASTLYNYDTDLDAFAGRVVLKGGAGASESDLTKYQNWQTAALTQPLELSGTVRVEFWAAVKSFSTSVRGDVTVYLRDYDGAVYTEIGNVTVTSDPWDAAASGTWVQATAAITGLDYTLPTGNQLEIKIIVPPASGDDMWLAYDTISYPASVTYADSLDLIFHTDEQRTGDLLSFLAETGPHDDGYYLHNNPTPPTLDTTSQADLTATTSYPSDGTLVNYDTDRDASAGLVLLQGGTGADEADLTKYQNWRTPVLTEPLEISGPVSINIWSAVKDFSTSLTGELKFFLRDYDGSTYTEIGDGTLSAGPWDAGATGTWVNRLLEISSIDYTLAAGHQIELKVIVGAGSADDMWLAYDTSSYDSVLRLPGQRDDDAAGRPLTALADAGGSTGRFSVDPNGGRFLYPLAGYTRITDSPWTVNYRVKRDGYGFVWLDNGVDITPGTIDSWQVVDLSASVPVGTTGAVVEIINTHPSNAVSGVARGGDDTTEYMPDGNAQKLAGHTHRWQVVEVNSSREIQGYVESTSNVLMRLVGYTAGTDPVYLSTPVDVSPATTGSWTTVDVSANVDADATGVILFLDATANDTTYGIREVGSSFSDITHRLEGESNGMYFVGIDTNDQFDIYLEDASIVVYLIAYTEQSVVYYTDDVAVADPAINGWRDIDADTYSISEAANGLILYAQNNRNSKVDFGIRKNGSTDDFDRELPAQAHLQGGVGIDTDNIWEEFIDRTDTDISIAAYTVARNIGNSVLHADADVLIRRANGDLRTTLATDVANSGDISVTDGWVTVTGTWTPSEYAIVDQTDYLELKIYADVTSNNNVATGQFRIDDNTVEVADQTGVSNLGLYRE